ncbi:alpha/beta fold hydrolase [Arthrobacter rhombi]|uniref:alpha/beta fold hydrolase n=1 Tax=Arthrobacter rhombi TaxID=71253 RepID=UPI003FD2AFC2
MPQITGADGNTLNYEDTGGEGHPIVLIHGWPLNGTSWNNQTGPLAEKGHRVITYDRRGFGSSEPAERYDYDALAADVAALLEGLDLKEVTLVGFSMGGGEVARYVSAHGEERLRSVVFASGVPPFLLKTVENPDGPLEEAVANDMGSQLQADRTAFFEGFMPGFYSAGDRLCVTKEQLQETIDMALQSGENAAAACMDAFGATDFREDLPTISVPTLVVHGDSDGVVPFEGSGQRTHEAIGHSELVLIKGAPHGLLVSHAKEFNAALLDFLER